MKYILFIVIEKIYRALRKVLPICHGFSHRCWRIGKRRRQNSVHAWVRMCDECAAECDNYWYDMWMDYYSGRT